MTELESLVVELRMFSLSHKKPITPFDNVCYLIQETLDVTTEELTSNKRHGYITEARQIGIFLLLDGEHSLKQAGDFFNIKNHTTVMYARDKVYNATEKNNAKFFNKLKLFGIK